MVKAFEQLIIMDLHECLCEILNLFHFEVTGYSLFSYLILKLMNIFMHVFEFSFCLPHLARFFGQNLRLN